MAKRELFLVIDIGSTALHIAEFESIDNSLVLHSFDNLEYNEPLNDDNRQDVVAATVRRALASGRFRAKVANISISGQAAFMRFVKLPPVTDDESSVKKIVEFEAGYYGVKSGAGLGAGEPCHACRIEEDRARIICYRRASGKRIAQSGHALLNDRKAGRMRAGRPEENG